MTGSATARCRPLATPLSTAADARREGLTRCVVGSSRRPRAASGSRRVCACCLAACRSPVRPRSGVGGWRAGSWCWRRVLCRPHPTAAPCATCRSPKPRWSAPPCGRRGRCRSTVRHPCRWPLRSVASSCWRGRRPPRRSGSRSGCRRPNAGTAAWRASATRGSPAACRTAAWRPEPTPATRRWAPTRGTRVARTTHAGRSASPTRSPTTGTAPRRWRHGSRRRWWRRTSGVAPSGRTSPASPTVDVRR